MPDVGENRALRDQFNQNNRQLVALVERQRAAYDKYKTNGPSPELEAEFKAIQNETYPLVQRAEAIKQQNLASGIWDPELAKRNDTQLSQIGTVQQETGQSVSSINRDLAQVKSQESAADAGKTAGDSVKEGADNTGTNTPTDAAAGESDTLTAEERQALDNPPVDGEPPSATPTENTNVSDMTNEDQSSITAGQSEETATLPTVTVTASYLPTYVATKNKLRDYASYTYNISLFMLTPSDYKTLVETPDTWTPRNCLIASAGRRGENFAARNPEFQEDFYFSNFSMTTVVGLNARTRATNAVDINFTVVEPYGLTLLDRIIAASDGLGSKNYLAMPYMLQIEFFGIADDGSNTFEPIPETTKRIPIRILTMKTKVTTGGAEYSIQASPFNHQAFQESTFTVPVNLEIEADTVQSFFDNNKDNVAEQLDSQRENRESIAAIQKAFGDGTISDDMLEVRDIYLAEIERLKKSAGKPVRASSYCGGVNAWMIYTRDQMFKGKNVGQAKTADVIEFNIHPTIANSKIVKPSRNDPSRTALKTAGTPEAVAVQKTDNVGPNFNTSAFSISAGTSVMKVIDMVMRSSEYITKQVNDPANKSPQELRNRLNKELSWYKVIPQVELLDFNSVTNTFAKKVTYHIVPYIVPDSKHPHGPSSKPKGWVKEYNYIYTGQNEDIIDFNIDFDALYFTAMSINRANSQTSTGQSGATEENTSTTNNPSAGKNSAFPRQYLPTSGDIGNDSGFSGERETTTRTVSDMQKSLYSSARGDMLSLKLKIIGDPDFIKQDDVYTNPGNKDYENMASQQHLPGSGSLVFDRGEIFCTVRFKTPADIDETTGLLKQDGKYVESNFSGLYKVLSVANELRSGRFEQTLETVRIWDDYDIIPAGTEQRRDNAPIDRDNTTQDSALLDYTAPDSIDGVDFAPKATNEADQAAPLSIPSDVQDLNAWGEENEAPDPDTDDLADIVDQDEAEVVYSDYQAAENTAPTDQPVKTSEQADVRQQQNQEQRVRGLEVEINQINTQLEDASAAVRSTQRKLKMAEETPGADPALKQELQNQLVRQQSVVSDLNAQLAAKEQEADSAAE